MDRGMRPGYAPAPPPHYPPPHPHTPHTPVEPRPHPPPHFSAPSYHQPPTSTPQAPPHHAYPPPPPPAQHTLGPSLPPLQQTHAAGGAAQNPQSLPPIYHAPPPHPHDARDAHAPDYHPYSQPHNRSSHATPAPVNRSYSHDSGHQQHTPTTPAYPPGTAPDGSQHPPPPSMDHGGHHGYPPTNGVPHGLPGPPQQHHQYEPPPHYSTMENHHGYPPQSQMYAQQGYGPASSSFASVQKRKQMRATQACEQCRQRKQKCDEGNPCSFCKENNLSCQYRDTPPAKTDKNMEKLLQYMETQTAAMENQAMALRELTSKVDNFDKWKRGVEHRDFHASPVSADDAPILDDGTKGKAELDDHRTAPHKLILLWPSVRPLLKDAGVTESDGYVMEAEDRPILRIYTKGEGIDEHDGTQAGGGASPASEESLPDKDVPSPPEGVWGVGFPPTPSAFSDVRRSEPSWGGLKPDGSLDLDKNTIDMLYNSYMRNIHVMHPFLDKGRVRKMFDRFIKKHSTTHRDVARFAVGNGSDSDRPLKRQRSQNGSNPTGFLGQQEPSFSRREPTERSPGNAIIWLVMALGKICLCKDVLPPPAENKTSMNTVISHQLAGHPGLTSSSPISATVKPSPTSPKSTPTAQPTPPGVDGVVRIDSRSRRSSIDGVQQSSATRNFDTTPGLAYYAMAAQILGDQGDGNDLVHAQMFLLAGLYKGQLARVKESMSWFNMAGRATRALLDRYKLYKRDWGTTDLEEQHRKNAALIKDKRHNLIVMAAWSCLQLESDILAELRLPSSGIQNVEDFLLNPHRKSDNEEENYDLLETEGEQAIQDDPRVILMFYYSQMFLRKRLNQVHKQMYGDQSLSQTIEEAREMLSGHEDILQEWRRTLPHKLQWRDDDPPPSDILEARLRAKYWGARYVINRPFLDYALHIMPYVREGQSIEAVARDANAQPRGKAEIHIFKAIETMHESTIWAAVGRCIDAAMKSTVAFDGIQGRLIITNIHGTAHAQFGNMLVLAATHYNSSLKTAVNADQFRILLDRTIKFLRGLAPNSPTCMHDCQILEKINRLFQLPPDAKAVYRNEGIEPQSATTSFSHST